MKKGMLIEPVVTSKAENGHTRPRGGQDLLSINFHTINALLCIQVRVGNFTWAGLTVFEYLKRYLQNKVKCQNFENHKPIAETNYFLIAAK